MGRGIEVFLLVLLGVVLFGAKRLPDAAKALGESLHLFKKAIRDDPPPGPTPPIRQVSGGTEPSQAPRATATSEQQAQSEQRRTDPGA